MDISGSYTLNAPREQVWNALRDPGALKRAIPGCESLEQTGDNAYTVRLNVGVAGVKGIYNGSLHVLDAQEPETYHLVMDGTGARGIVHSDGVLRLEAQATETTVVHYAGQAQLGGAIASVGPLVATGAANRLIKEYFTRLADLLPPASVADAGAAKEPLASEPSAAPAQVPADQPPAAASIVAPDMATTTQATADTSPAEELSAPTPAPAATPAPVADNAPTTVDAFLPPPTAPLIQPHHEQLATPAPLAPLATQENTPMATAARQAGMADGSIESGKQSARTIGILIIVAAVVIAALVVWFVVGALR
jgi:carbon monoxide dehydrogenase subunit G